MRRRYFQPDVLMPGLGHGALLPVPTADVCPEPALGRSADGICVGGRRLRMKAASSLYAAFTERQAEMHQAFPRIARLPESLRSSDAFLPSREGPSAGEGLHPRRDETERLFHVKHSAF